NIGLDALRMGDYKAALDHNKQALDIFREIYGEQHLFVAMVLDQLGSLYDLQKNYQTSITYYEAALAMMEDLFGEQNYDVARINLNISTTYADAGMRKEALASSMRALDLIKEVLGAQNLTVAWYYSNLGEVLLQFNEYDAALEQIQFALTLMDSTLDARDFHQNPTSAPIGFTSELFRIMSAKGQLLLAMAGQKGDSVSYMEASLASYRRGAELVDTLRLHYGHPESRHTLAGEARSTYNGGIQTAWRLYRVQQDSRFLDDVFYFAERNRSMELMQTLHQNQALQYAGIPKNLLDEVRKLGTLIAAREKQMYEAEAEGEEVPPSWSDEIFDLQVEYDALMDRLEQDFPDYYALKYGRALPALSQIQAALPEDCAMLNYMQAGQNIFGLMLDKRGAHMVDLGSSQEIDSLVLDLRRAVPTPVDGGREWTSNQKILLESSHALFQRLLAPFKALGPLPTQLIIVPQGNLSLVPFDALIEEPGATSPKEIAYLLRKHEVAMAFSAGQWLAVRKGAASNNAGKWLGFAPSFGDTQAGTPQASIRSDVLQPLAYNRTEVEAIRSYIGGIAYLGTEASEVNFKQNAGEYAMLHISSHAFVDPENALYSGIAFTPEADSAEDGFLDLAELFTLQLPAEMAVLSACETNIGTYLRGEGVMSLARGFAYAGVESVVATLWQVNDAATAQIMEQFYVNLKAGNRKSEALRAAKLAYLDQADNLSAHPYFWSGFVPIGNMEPLRIDPAINRNMQWLVVLILLAGGLGFWWQRRKGGN
ncbi:MAG: CHAT domain-containing tetratricopeptide repeat protein, partial [Bacteroidota bacterium]